MLIVWNFCRQKLNISIPVKTIVVTHHVPTFQNYPLNIRGCPNEAFAVELTPLIEQTFPDIGYMVTIIAM